MSLDAPLFDLHAIRRFARAVKRIAIDRTDVQLVLLPAPVLQACRAAGLRGMTTTARRFVATIDSFVRELEHLQREQRRAARRGLVRRLLALFRRRPQPALTDGAMYFLVASRARGVDRADVGLATAAALVVDLLLARAVAVGASSLHIDIDGDVVRVRCRIAGALHAVSQRRVRDGGALIARLLVLGGLDVTQRHHAQSSSCTLTIDAREHAATIAVLPTARGACVTVHFAAVDVVARHHRPLVRPAPIDLPPTRSRSARHIRGAFATWAEPPSPAPPILKLVVSPVLYAGRIEPTRPCSPQPLWEPDGWLGGLNESKLRMLHAMLDEELPGGVVAMPTFRILVLVIARSIQRAQGCSAVDAFLWRRLDGSVTLCMATASTTRPRHVDAPTRALLRTAHNDDREPFS